MQITETAKSGLSRTYSVSVAAADLVKHMDARIASMAPQMKLKGFRPGHAPTTHVKKLYGKAIMGEVIEQVVSDASKKTIEDGKLRPIAEPEIKLTSEIEAVMDGTAALTFDLILDVMPEFETADVSKISLTRLTAEPSDEQVNKTLGELAENNTSFEEKKGAAKLGDQTVIDFIGRIDGVAFAGGTGNDFGLTLGSGQFIPGFEDQLVGAKAGDVVMVKVPFPADYPSKDLAGKEAEFECTVKAVKAPAKGGIDDALAKQYGLSSLEALKEAVKSRLQRDIDEASRAKLKRELLDALDELHDFDLPAKMVDEEFDGVWAQVQQAISRGDLTEEDKGKSEDDLKAEYRAIAERRVRLGLVLAEIGQKSNVQVTQEEVARAINAQAAQYPGREREIADYFRKNPGAMARMRAPIYEEKVCDHIFATAKVTDKAVSVDEVMAEDETPVKAKPAKTKAAKPKAEKADAAEKTEAKADKPAKKPAAKKAKEQAE
jgi:trigger factor